MKNNTPFSKTNTIMYYFKPTYQSECEKGQLNSCS